MIGEKIAEMVGQTTGVRVLPATADHEHLHGHGPVVEVSMQQQGKIYGIDVTDMGTYEACLQTGGFYEGRGQGVVMTRDGEVVSWTGTGIGRPTGKGLAVNWRGSLHYQTKSQKLAKLNGTCFVFEFDTDEQGKTSARIFEWK